MKGIFSLRSIFVMVCIIFCCSCATSAFKSVWDDSAYKGGPFKKVLVMVVARSQYNQGLLEDGFVRQLTARGVTAIAGHTVFPADVVPDRKAVMDKIRELGIDAVLVASIVNVENEGVYETYPQEFKTGYYDYYLQCCQATVTTGYIVMIETKVFDARYNKAIWSGLSESAFRTSLGPAIHSFVSLVIRNLHEKKLLP